ncbi:MAG: VWA domain-containing protein, partial [Vicinamibacterales bacterium]
VKVLQPFTTDRERVRRAIERVLPSGTAAAEQHADRANELTARKREIESQSDSTSAQAGAGNSALVARNASAMGIREAERRLVQTELNMMRSFDNLDRDMRGYESSLALSAVIDSLSLYHGRKTIVLFSEGLPASPVLSAKLERVIEAANRANVTAYVVDAHGLRATSTLAATRKEMEDFADERLRQLASSRDETNQPLTLAFERVEDTMRLDSRTGLARLAEDTGGILVDGTNDLSAALRRIDEDNQFHYLLSYSPKNDALDGAFRRIDVKVRRPRTQVFARKGYRAVRAPGMSHAGAVDAAALSLLGRGSVPNAFAMYAAGFSFPDPGRPGLTALLVNVGSGVADFTVDPRRGTYSAQLAIVVRITDHAGQELQKFSQQYALSGEAKDLEAAKNGNILFYREATLPPGVYTVESVVYDAAADRGSARVATLTVPAVDAKAPGVSSLVLVNRVEQLKDAPTADPGPPLYVGSTLLYPNLGEAFPKSATTEVPFYFAAYGDTSRAQWFVQLVRNGNVLAEAPITLPPATGTRVQHVGRIPVRGLATGTYELRIRATAGAEEVSRSAYFTLRD